MRRLGLLIGLVFLAGCYRPAPPPTLAPALPTMTPLPGGTADIRADGSSLVAPITETIAEGFHAWSPQYKVTIDASGTSGGFERMCRGEIDLVNAMRPISGSESSACTRGGIDWVEVIVAYDVMVVVTNPKDTFVECLTVEELRTLWSGGDDDILRENWSMVREGFPTLPVKPVTAALHPAQERFFAEAVGIVTMRGDVLSGGADPIGPIMETPGAVGYLDYGHYRRAERLGAVRAVAVDAGLGCTLPEAEAVWNGNYALLSHPLYLYMNTASLQRHAVLLFVRSYLDSEGQARIAEAGYMPAPPANYERALATVEAHADQR